MKMMNGVFLSLTCLFSSPVLAATSVPADEILELVRQDAKPAFGEMKEDIYLPDVKISSALLELLGPSINESPEAFGNYMMIYGCRVQSCTEKAAVIVDFEKKRIAAAGLINFHCKKSTEKGENRLKSRVSCEKSPILNTYLFTGKNKTQDDNNSDLLLSKIHQWATTHSYEREVLKKISRK
ncbi:hypothetical protein GJ700_32610 [Duganella sp. FT92W]|uniref:Uncharacterized protein n=1 Tax=Pseudoduganella rivuli TaxID=2666085 RepID=A0A7X2IUW8_9BURK|nr:hypothetical protein [Pseudoduganella rivuli]MRV76464.1 hypothetical protein [Pseudoduganella rivuli]